MTPKSRRAKGKEFELRIAQLIAEWIDLPLSDVVRSRSGSDECDVALSAEGLRRYPYWTECKNQRKISIPEWIKQAEETCAKRGAEGQVPIVVFKIHGDGTPYVVLEFHEFMRLVTEKLNEGKQK